MRRIAWLGLLAAVACATSPVLSLDLGPAPPAPAYLKDLPDEMRGDIPVNYTQAKVGDAAAPELLVASSGKAITTADAWTRTRRPEVEQLLIKHQYGVAPSAATSRVADITYDYSERAVSVMDGLAVRTQSTVTLASELGEHTIDVLLYTPTKATGPSPTVLMVNFSPSFVMVDDPAVRVTDGWANGQVVPGREARAIAKQDLKPFLERGYGVALVYYGQIEPDFGGGASDGIRKVYKPANSHERASNEAGSIAAWAEGLSLVRAHLAEDKLVDGGRIALYGISRLGKTALWAGAVDQGFAAVIAVCSGEGGAALSRRIYGETIAHAAASFPYWFAPRWSEFASDPASSPVDAHMAIAMIAPRSLMLIAGETDHWSDPYGEFLAARLASPVWRLFGEDGVVAAPVLDQPTGGALTYMMHSGGHGPVPQDTPAILDFLDRSLVQDRN